MPKIPDVLDYGAQPSFRSDRIRVVPDETAVSDSLMRAADEFVAIAKDRKQKNDSLTYSRAKSDVLQADARIRRELEDKGDYENYEADYRAQLTTEIDRIAPTVSDAWDRELFAADTRLTTERGVSAMSEMRRRDWEVEQRANLMQSLEDKKRYILSVDHATANDAMFNAQEYIRDAVRQNIIRDDLGIQMLHNFIRDTAGAQLTVMEPGPRAEALRAAIAANADPNAEDYAPTGSLADFLQQDQRVEMLRIAEKQVEVEDTIGSAQAVVDEAFSQYTGVESGQDRLNYIRNSDLDPKARKEAVSQARARNTELENARRREGTNRYNSMMDIVHTAADNGEPIHYSDLPADEVAALSDPQFKELKRTTLALLEGRKFGETNEIATVDDDVIGIEIDGEWFPERPSLHLWNRLTHRQKQAVDLNDPEWRFSFTSDRWESMSQEQEGARQGRGSQERDVQTNIQMLKGTLSHLNQYSAGARGKTKSRQDKRFQLSFQEFSRRIAEKQKELDRYPTEPERAQILSEMMAYRVWKDALPDAPDLPLALLVGRPGQMPDEQIEEAVEGHFASLDEAKILPYQRKDGRQSTYYEYLAELAVTPVDKDGAGRRRGEVTEREYEIAYMFLRSGYPEEMAVRALQGAFGSGDAIEGW